jgi:hypothetical protein
MRHESFGTPRSAQPQEAIFHEELTANDSAQPNESLQTLEVVAPKRELWNPVEAVLLYRERLNSLYEKQKELEEIIAMIHDDESIADRFDERHLQELLQNRETLQQEILAASANYPGDWTNFLYERLSDPITKERFIAERTRGMETMLPGTPSFLDRDGRGFTSHYQEQINTYDDRLNFIFSQTRVGPAEKFGYKPNHLGKSNINETGTVFTDSTHKGVPLTARQMNIVESHEKGHGFRDFHSPTDTREIRAVIDTAALEKLTTTYRELEATGQKEGRFRSVYVNRPEEIVERMAQFKNYFGMRARDTFEKKHLDYIREHYVSDIGLDNGVTDLLMCITPETEAAFLKIINEYPI